MLTEKNLLKYADVMVWGLKKARTAPFKKKDIVMIRFNLAAIDFAEILQAKLMDMGVHVLQRLLPTSGMELTFFNKADKDQLIFQAPGEKELYRNLNGYIYLNAPDSLTHLKNADPAKIAQAAIARKPLRDILQRREEEGKFGWSLCVLPTKEMAKHAKLSLKEYTSQILKACYLNKKDPVAMWEDIFKDAQSIKKWLNSLRIKEYHVESDHVDLKVAHGQKRKWIGISGHNIPSFELFISPDWRGTEGVYFANQPSYRDGNYVKGVRLEFNNGSVVKIDAESGKNFVQKQLAMDPGANKLGEFSLTDRRFSKIDRFMADTLFDENFGGKDGNCHVALGSSYSDTYRGNPAELTRRSKKELGFNDSALHWDLVNTEKKRVTARLTNGKKIVIYENGKFAY